MHWNRSNAIGLACASCTRCEGQGIRLIRGGAERPCGCVFRAIFRACYRRFRDYSEVGARAGTVSLEMTRGPVGYRVYSRKREEYMADFCLVARRALSEIEQQIFRYTFLLGAGNAFCMRRVGIDRGTYFHHIYRIEEKLGRQFAETEPYPLYPLDEYFGGAVRSPRIAPASAALPVTGRTAVRLPLSA